ncbi:GIY-YIG nuclease family protein [Prescottella equi]|uniref:GIY-YIG nuclease family protein n=1 Tax=Rhodococcus phage REQ2 TaxID=1109713 RepID=G9FH22_9CAUD|nr:GIY-YIG nuclease family protein [Prescottella equi]YP_005087123.1 GIY-YIG nuclease family protein [Rhodococcus phage REQ2]AEV51933.1 hypothetical protein [Rhodococcus phage REQ2]
MTDHSTGSQNPFKPTCALPVERENGVPSPCGETVHVPLFLQGIHLCAPHALRIWELLDEELGSTGEATRLRAARRRAQRKGDLPAQPDTGYVYYLRVGEHIKIGYAANLEQRLASYPPDTDLLAVEPGTMRDETERHRTFRSFRVSGREWYEQRPILMDHIAKVAENKRHTWWDDAEWRRKNPSAEQVVKPKSWR